MTQPISFQSINHWCQSESGHFYHYHLCVQQAAMAAVADVKVYIPINAHFFNEPNGWTRWFHAFYNRKNRRLFWKDCKTLFKAGSTNPRIFFIEFFGRRDFALFALAALLFKKKNDHLWILYRDDLTIRRKKDQTTIRFFSKCLRMRFNKRFLPLTDSELLADYYEGWFKQRPMTLPIPHTFAPTASKSANNKTVCFVPSGARPEQGPQWIAPLVVVNDPAASKIELVIPGNLNVPPETNGIEVTLRRTSLSTTAYQAALSQSDVVLLPYDSERYKWRTSGPFVEAVALGKMPLVREGSWLAYELKRFELDKLIVDWADPLFFTHLLDLLQDQQLLAKLKTMQNSYLLYHSQENFTNTVKNLVHKHVVVKLKKSSCKQSPTLSKA